MKKYIIILAFLSSFSITFAENSWEKVYEFEKHQLENMSSLSKDTFLISTYFNSRRNGNITFEYALKMTTDVGVTWKNIYQDSTSPYDIPIQAQRIVDVEVTDNNNIIFLRQDGYILYTSDFGSQWDSVKTSFVDEKVGVIRIFKNKVLAYFQYTDSLFIFDSNNKKIESIYFQLPLFNGEEGKILNFTDFEFLSDNNIIFAFNYTTEDTTYNFTYITNDKGKTWNLYERENTVTDYSFITNKVGYSCGTHKFTSRIYDPITKTGKFYFASVDKTTDDGVTWENVFISEDNVFFREMTISDNMIICLPKYPLNLNYEINPYSSSNLIDFEIDSIANENPRGGTPREIACDDFGNCILIQDRSHVHRILNPKSSVIEIPIISDDYLVEYYDLQGNRIDGIRNESNLNSGLYLKVFKDKSNQIIKTDKLIITK